MLFSILTGITILFIVLVVVAVYKRNDNLLGISLAMLFVTVLLGWMLLGGLIPQSEVQETLIVNVLHDKNSVHISHNGQVIQSYTDIATFSFLSEKNEVKVLHTVRKNMYRNKIHEKWELIP